MARKLLSEYQENWIKTHANNSCREDQYKEFCLNFGNIITFSQFSCWRRNNKIKGPKNIHSVSKHKAFTAEEEQFILENYKKYESPQIVILLKEKFGTTHTKQQIKSFRNRYKLNSGFTGGFNANRPNPHKGDKSFIIPGGEKSRFQTGHSPTNKAQINDEIIDSYGYHKIKIAEHNWQFKHHLIWEKAYGPIPDGYSVIFLDGNKDNLNLDNLKLVSMKARGKMLGRKWNQLTDPELTLAAVNVCELSNKIQTYEEKNERA